MPDAAKTKLKGIMCYGTPEDKAKLKALSKATGKTDSRWLIDTIREAHAAIKPCG